MPFSAPLFNTFLADIGVTTDWRRASECPCRNARTGGTDTQCPVCEGLRYLWEDPVRTVIGVQSLGLTQQWGKQVEWEQGDMIATIPSDSPAYACGEFDRFILVEAENRWNTVLVKGQQDKLKHTLIKSIERVFTVVGGSIQEFTEWDQYERQGRTIVWYPEAGLADGTQYSIRYVAAPEYFVFHNIPQDRPQFNLDLPRKVPLRLMDLFSQAVH